jgi:hypothetical protein
MALPSAYGSPPHCLGVGTSANPHGYAWLWLLDGVREAGWNGDPIIGFWHPDRAVTGLGSELFVRGFEPFKANSE